MNTARHAGFDFVHAASLSCAFAIGATFLACSSSSSGEAPGTPDVDPSVTEVPGEPGPQAGQETGHSPAPPTSPVESGDTDPLANAPWGSGSGEAAPSSAGDSGSAPVDGGLADAADGGASDAQPGDGAVLDAGDGATSDAATPTGPLVDFSAARAVVAGSGCSAVDAAVTAQAGTLGVTFGALHIQLPAGGGPLAERRACSVRIPMTIPAGYYVAKLTQRADYALSKSAGATASLSTHATVSVLPSAPLTIHWPSGRAVSSPSGTATRDDAYDPTSAARTAMCSGQPTTGLFAVNLALTAQRGRADSVSLAVRSYTLRQGSDLVLAPCSP